MAKQDRKRINRAIALVASVVLAVGLVPVPAIAVGTGDELGGLASEASPAAATPDAVPLTQGDEGTASDEQPAKAESPAFSQSATVDGVTVTVEADAGVFPEGARLSVESVPSSATEAAVASEREADVNVVASYTFDIKVLDADGAELQPADGKSVRVSFKAAEVADPNLDVSVYHVPEGASGAEELGVDVSGATATAESGGFSYYTVEFTYGELQYVLKGGEKVALADILSAVGLSGEVTAVEVSNSELFSASKESGGWVITSHKAFSSEEWMRVTIGGKSYEIKVTDEQSGTCGNGLTWTLSGRTLTISKTGEGDGKMTDYDHPTLSGNKSPWYDNSDIKQVVIGNGVTSIGDFAFYACRGLESVTIPSSVTAIGVAAFYYCEPLRSVTIPGSVKSIGNSAFNCTSLKSVTIPHGVESIGERAFDCCFSLESVTIPPTVNTVGQYAFQTGGKLDVRFGGSEAQWASISAPAGTQDRFSEYTQLKYVCGKNLPWTLSGEGDNLTLTITGTGAMYDYFGGSDTPWYDRASKITSIVFNGEVTTIGSWAFNECDKLKSVAIPNSVKVIGAGAFADCSSLAGVEIPNGVEAIEPDAFSACKIESIEIPISVKTIGESAFASCNELEAVAIPSSVTSVGRDAFLYKKSDNLVRRYYFGGTVEQFASLMGISLEEARLMVEKVYQEWLDCMPAVAISSSFEEGGSAEGVGAYSIANSSWSYTATATPSSDYKFVNWTENGTQVSSVATDIFSVGENGRTLVANFESTTTSHTITTEANPAAGGSVTGGGSHARGGTVTLTATAATDKGYHFVNWTENGTQVSTDASYSFIATADRTLVANFELDKYDITAAADPQAGGTVSGGGTFTYGQTATLTATPSEGYVFDYWSTAAEPNTSVCKTEEYEATVTGSQSYVAHFRQISIVEPDGSQLQSRTYTGSSITFPIKVYLVGVDVAFIEAKDFMSEFTDNLNVGTATVTVELEGSYKGTATAAFDIVAADISTATVEAADQVYDGTALEPAPTVTWDKMQVAKEDYTVSYTDNVRAGTATVTVAGKRNFSEASKASGTFEIAARPVTVTADSAERVYDGTALTADGFTSEGLAEGDKVASAKVEGSQTDVGSSANTVSGAKIVNAAGEDVTNCYDITYKDGTLTVKPGEKGTYEAASGSGSTWVKGSTDPVTLTFKRAADDERTFDLFGGVEVDGKAVPEKASSGKANWTAKKGSLILSLQPSFLETLADGDHTVKALFEDGAGEATFKVAAKPAPTPTTKHIVTFDANGHGDAPAAQTIEDGKTAFKPADPAADGWEFGGWFTDGECRQAYDFATPVTSDLTLYAKWTQKAAAGKATSPKTGDAPSLLPVMALLLLSAAALCLALFALSQRKPAHAGKHARR